MKRAAETRAGEIQKAKWFDSKKDTVLLRGVRTKSDFANVIKEANSLDKKFGKVQELTLFAHSGQESDPVFHGAAITLQNGAGSTQFSSAELKSLPKINWTPSANAYFYGCHTTNFAGQFASDQHVLSFGTSGSSYFSSRPDRLKPDNGGHLYLIDTRFNQNLAPNRINTTKPMEEHKP